MYTHTPAHKTMTRQYKGKKKNSEKPNLHTQTTTHTDIKQKMQQLEIESNQYRLTTCKESVTLPFQPGLLSQKCEFC